MKHFVKRALAYMIDCVICYALIMLVVQWAILSNIRYSIGITDDWFIDSFNTYFYVLTSISIPVLIYFTYFDSQKSKGTFGKRLMKLTVHDSTQHKINLGKSFLRTLLKLAPWEIAHIGVIFPTPMYFQDQPNIRALTIIGIVLFLVYMISIVMSPDGRSIYDKIVGTIVTNESKI